MFNLGFIHYLSLHYVSLQFAEVTTLSSRPGLGIKVRVLAPETVSINQSAVSHHTTHHVLSAVHSAPTGAVSHICYLSRTSGDKWIHRLQRSVRNGMIKYAYDRTCYVELLDMEIHLSFEINFKQLIFFNFHCLSTNNDLLNEIVSW